MLTRSAIYWPALLALAGCASSSSRVSVPPAPLASAEAAQVALDARSLQGAGLRRFLIENLGHDPGVVGSWDFETFSWAAFYFHPSLALARAQWATARAAQATAAMRPNPILTVSPGYNFTRQPGLSPWFPGINLDFLFPNSEKRARQQDFARAEADVARLGFLVTVWQVRSELRRALTEAATASRRAEAQREQAERQRKLVQLIARRVEAGGAAAGELSTVRAGLLRAEAAAAEALSQAATARVRVATALAIPAAALENFPLPTPAAPALSGEALALARRESLRSRGDILAALSKYQAAQSALDLEVAKRLPDFHLGPGYQWDQGENKWSLALSFELPLFHRNEAPIAEAAARRAEAAAQFAVVQSQVLGAIDGAMAARDAADRQLEHARQLRREIAAQQELTRQRFELGAIGQFDVQTAAIDLAAVEPLIVDAENAVTSAAGQLEDALQLPFPHLAMLAESTRGHALTSP